MRKLGWAFHELGLLQQIILIFIIIMRGYTLAEYGEFYTNAQADMDDMVLILTVIGCTLGATV